MKRRLDHAVTSKNIAKMNAALTCAASHIIRPPNDFNADRMMVAVENATLRFNRKTEPPAKPETQKSDRNPGCAGIHRCLHRFASWR